MRNALLKAFAFYHWVLFYLAALVLIGAGIFLLGGAYFQTQLLKPSGSHVTVIFAASLQVSSSTISIINQFHPEFLTGPRTELVLSTIFGGISLAMGFRMFARRFSLKMLCITIFMLAYLFTASATLPIRSPANFMIIISDPNGELSCGEGSLINTRLTPDVAFKTIPAPLSEKFKTLASQLTAKIQIPAEAQPDSSIDQTVLSVDFDQGTPAALRGVILEFYFDYTARLVAEIIAKRNNSAVDFKVDRYETDWQKYRDEWLAKLKSDSK